MLFLSTLMVLALVLFGAATFYWSSGLSVSNFVETIQDLGAWGVVASIALMVVHSFVPFPAELLACANGMVYGRYWGTLISWIGAMLGAILAFGLARRLGRPFVEKMISGERAASLDRWRSDYGWQAILFSRFVPIIAFNLINYAAGLTRLTWWQFLWTTGIGILPLTFLMALVGERAQVMSLSMMFWLMVAGLLLWLALHFWQIHRSKTKPASLD